MNGLLLIIKMSAAKRRPRDSNRWPLTVNAPQDGITLCLQPSVHLPALFVFSRAGRWMVEERLIPNVLSSHLD